MQLPDDLDYGWLFRQLLQSSADSIYVKDRQGRILLASGTMARNLGFSCPTQLVGRTDSSLFDAEFARRTQLEDERVMATGQPIEGLIESRRLSGSAINWTLTSKYPLTDETGQIVGLIGTTCEINDLKQTETALQYLATHDNLTALPNRYLMLDRLGQTIARAERHSDPFAVLFLDVDDFKAINDSFGHAGGDQVLRVVARRLLGSVRASDTIARISGDEFVVVIDGASEADASAVAAKIQRAIARPVRLGGRSVRVTVSIGIGLYPQHASSAESLLSAADGAMYVAKQRGKNGFVVLPAKAA